jgi:hypothetical protein
MAKKTTLQATGDFPFTFFIEKAIPVEEGGQLIVEGVASTMNVDHDNERMAQNALESMANIINEKTVPLRMEHSKEDSAIVGSVYKAWVDERNQLWIRAAIDPKHPAGPMLHSSLKDGAKFGLSVGGRVKNAMRELAESTGKMVKTFYDVILDEVSVTRKPANYDAWLFAKSLKTEDEDITPFYKSAWYNRFLFENLQLDYIYQFEKSIPSGAWERVDTITNINKDMKKAEDKKENPFAEEKEKAEEGEKETETETKKKVVVKDGEKDEEEKEKAEEGEKKDDEAEKSYVTKADFSKFMTSVTKGFASITKALDTNAKDTVNPSKEKEETLGDTAKAEEGEKEEGEDKEKSEADGDDGKKQGDVDALDQTNPDKKMEENVGDTAKSEDGEKEEDKEKAEDGEKKDDVEEATKAIERALKSIRTPKFSKSEEVVEKSEVSAIDRFAMAVAASVDELTSRIEKNDARIPGLARAIVDRIVNDSELQSEIAGMMKESGFKKSVQFGTPYMRTKDGKMYALSAKAVGDEKIKKSQEGKDFKSVYKADFSSFTEENQ